MPIADVGRMPGWGSEVSASFRKLWWSIDHRILLPAGLVINGSLSRDPLNTSYLDVLRAGLLMGRITSTGKYAPSIIGVLGAAYTSGGTSLTVSAATATEVERRIGASGTGYVVGPPTAGGTVAATALTYSAVGATSITCTSLGVDKIAGSFICADDGTHIPRTLVGKEDGIKVTDRLGNSCDVVFPEAAVGGMLITSQIVNCPSDTALLAWVKAQLNSYGRWFFDDDYIV